MPKYMLKLCRIVETTVPYEIEAPDRWAAETDGMHLASRLNWDRLIRTEEHEDFDALVVEEIEQ